MNNNHTGIRTSVFHWFLIVLMMACVDPYQPPLLASESGYLVVDGFINIGNGPTTIKLSRTISLDEEGEPPKVRAAEVTVEDDENTVVILPETAEGSYGVDQLNLDHNRKYRLHIITAGGKEYLSAFLEAKNTPPIDSLTYDLNRERNSLQIKVSTHDPSNKTRYYQWDYEETWHYTSDYHTFYEYTNGEIIFNPQLSIYNCWQTQASHQILAASSVRLKEDVIHKFPIVSITPESEKARILYSVLVHQYALTQAAFEYHEELRKLTEAAGGIFDPLPYQLRGNIESINHDEPALGYVSAYNVESKRLFIPAPALPGWFTVAHKTCPEDCPALFPEPDNCVTIQNCVLPCFLNGGPERIKYFLSIGFIYPAPQENWSPTNPSAYKLKICVDCRERGGTNVKPDFWP